MVRTSCTLQKLGSVGSLLRIITYSLCDLTHFAVSKLLAFQTCYVGRLHLAFAFSGGFSGARDEGQGRWGREAPAPTANAPSDALSGMHLKFNPLFAWQQF